MDINKLSGKIIGAAIEVRPLKNASRCSGIQVQASGPLGLRPGGEGENFNHRNTLSILRIALKVSATLHSVSLRAKC